MTPDCGKSGRQASSRGDWEDGSHGRIGVIFGYRASAARHGRDVMVFVIGGVLVVAAILLLGLVLGRRGPAGLGSNTDAGRAPEEFRVPGSGGGNAGGFAG